MLRRFDSEGKPMRKGNKPKRLFKGNRLTSESRRIIDEATEGFPQLGPTLYELFTTPRQPDILQIFALVSPAQRGALALALRDACRNLLERKPCDLCSRVASKVHFVFVPADGDCGPVERPAGAAFTVFAVLCDRCAEIPVEQRDRKLLEEFARHQQRLGRQSSRRRPAIIGQLVGEGTNLSARSALETCEQCHKSVWYALYELERMGETGGSVSFLCRNCAEQRFRAGKLDILAWEAVALTRRDSA